MASLLLVPVSWASCAASVGGVVSGIETDWRVTVSW